MDLKRGQEKTIDIETTNTKQRTASYGVMGFGVAGLAAGATLGGLAFAQQSDAKAIQDGRAAGLMRTEQDRVAYTDAIAARDTLRTGATVAPPGTVHRVTA